MDELGYLELSGRGFAQLAEEAIRSACPICIFTVKKSALLIIEDRFGLHGSTVIDMDETPLPEALRRINHRMRMADAERIGVYSSISGVMEIGFGSMLHAYRIPWKGHILAYIQNALLVYFGKQMKGRGLVRISFITSMLKAFSPAGARLKPMACIFAQGAVFSLPIALLGWNLASVLGGSLLMSWLTLAISLGMDYVIFGRSIFDAYVGAARAAFGTIGWTDFGFWHIVLVLFFLKSIGGAVIGIGSYQYFLTERLLKRLPASSVPIGTRAKPAGSAYFNAVKDIFNRRFIMPFIISILIIYFFTGLPRNTIATVALRGLIIAWFGFLAARRVNFQKLMSWLVRHGHEDLVRSLEIAIRRIAPGKK